MNGSNRRQNRFNENLKMDYKINQIMENGKFFIVVGGRSTVTKHIGRNKHTNIS